jgi:hypothetical protein
MKALTHMLRAMPLLILATLGAVAALNGGCLKDTPFFLPAVGALVAFAASVLYD